MVCLLSWTVIEVCFGLFAASLDLVNWLQREKNNNNGSLWLSQGSARGKKKSEKERKAMERKSSVFTDPISTVPQQCGIKTKPEHYQPHD